MTQRVLAVIQARMGSTRLPGKVLMEVEGETMLARVVRRVGRARAVHRTIVATTAGDADEPIARECERLNVELFRGSELDVLDRFFRAACLVGAGTVVRITADCPLIDPHVIDRVVTAFLDWRPDYASNVLRRTYPRGLDTEVMDVLALERAWREATEPYERVHVTPYFYHHPERFRLLSVTRWESGVFTSQTGDDANRFRWTVDTAEDLRLVREIYRRLGQDGSFGWTDVLELLRHEPALAAWNSAVRQKALHEG